MKLTRAQEKLLERVRWMDSPPDPFPVEVIGAQKRTAKALERLGLVTLWWEGVGHGPWEVSLSKRGRRVAPEISFRGVVVNGYDRQGGLQFSRKVTSEGDFRAALEEAATTPHVVDIEAGGWRVGG
jgi:hypothetical protein